MTCLRFARFARKNVATCLMFQMFYEVIDSITHIEIIVWNDAPQVPSEALIVDLALWLELHWSILCMCGIVCVARITATKSTWLEQNQTLKSEWLCFPVSSQNLCWDAEYFKNLRKTWKGEAFFLRLLIFTGEVSTKMLDCGSGLVNHVAIRFGTLWCFVVSFQYARTRYSIWFIPNASHASDIEDVQTLSASKVFFKQAWYTPTISIWGCSCCWKLLQAILEATNLWLSATWLREIRHRIFGSVVWFICRYVLAFASARFWTQGFQSNILKLKTLSTTESCHKPCWAHCSSLGFVWICSTAHWTTSQVWRIAFHPKYFTTKVETWTCCHGVVATSSCKQGA